MSPWAKFSSLRIPYTIEYPSAISAYRLPRTIPFRRSSNAPPHPSERTVSTRLKRGRCKGERFAETCAAHLGGPHRWIYVFLLLADANVLAAGLDMEDREVGGRRHVARPLRRSCVLRQEADREAKQRCRLAQVRLLDVLTNLGA